MNIDQLIRLNCLLLLFVNILKRHEKDDLEEEEDGFHELLPAQDDDREGVAEDAKDGDGWPDASVD